MLAKILFDRPRKTEQRGLGLKPWLEYLEQVWYGGSKTAAGIDVSEEIAFKVSAFHCAIKIIAETIASLPCVLYERKENDGRDRAVNHPVYSLIHDIPNQWQTSYDFWEYNVACALLRGTAYNMKIRDRRGYIRALEPIHPDRIQPNTDSETLTFTLKKSSGEEEIISADRIFRFAAFTKDGIQGRSLIEYMAEQIGVARAQDEYAARFFSNGASPSGILVPKLQSRITDDTVKAMRERLNELHTGAQNAHRILIPPIEFDWKQISLSAEDSQLLESRKFTVSDIARVLRIPPHMLGDLDRATFSNIEHQSLEFVVYTLRPWLTRIEKAIQRDLLSPEARKTYYAEFLVDALLRGDITSRYTAYAQGRQWGWLSANDIRKKENMNPLGKEGDVYLAPTNMLPADKFMDMEAPSQQINAPDAGSQDESDSEDQDQKRLLNALQYEQQLEDLHNAHRDELTDIQRKSQNELLEQHANIKTAYHEILAEAVQRVLRKEQKAAKAAQKKSENLGDIQEWARTWHSRHGDYLGEVFYPIFNSFSYAIHGENHDTITGEFLEGYSKRWNDSAVECFNALNGYGEIDGMLEKRERDVMEIIPAEMDRYLDFIDQRMYDYAH